MKNLPEIYEEADENDIMIFEHKIGGRKSIPILKIRPLSLLIVN